jgi:hypothetical protein
MKFILSAAIACGALLGMHSCAQAQVQSNDIAFARKADGAILALSMQPCPFSGFYWWHMETPEGRTIRTGCWTFATHRRIMLTDGKGGAEYLPSSRFSTNPGYGE